MARQKTMYASALNITIHPHSPRKYVKLLKMAHASNVKAKIRGTDWGTIGWIRPLVPDNDKKGLIGEFYRFINIDPFDSWFDEINREVITIDGEVVAEPPVPEHLKPHLRKVLFTFYPKMHLLVFDSKQISSTSIRNLLHGILNAEELREKFGDVTVNVESSHEGVRQILNIKQKSKIEIYITLPNPDDNSDDEQRVLDRLNSVKARKLSEIYTSHRGETLEPDDDMITLMNVAKSNGRVYARGYDDTGKVEKSTEDYPIKLQEQYNPNVTTEPEAIQRLSASIMREISRLN